MKSIRDRLLEKAARKHLPIMSAFELLPVCNLQCKMCYVRKSMSEVRAAGGLKDASWWLALAEEAKECGLLFPLLTGGEPFLHPQFFEILSGMHKMGLQVSINSNGTLIDRQAAIELSNHPPVRINITLYGASEEVYERLCGDGNAYGRVRKAVELLKEYNIPVKFNASITPDNVQDLEAMITYAKEQGSPIQVATYMFPPIRRDHTMIGVNARLTPEEAAFARVQADYWQNAPEWFVMQARRYQAFVPLEKLSLEKKSATELGLKCRAGLCSVWIDWQGNMMNCGMYGSAGASLEGRSFREAWEELVKETEKVRYQPACAECPNQALCHPCIAMISNECGNLHGRPEYMCQMNQALAKYYKEFAEKYYSDVQVTGDSSVKNIDICEL